MKMFKHVALATALLCSSAVQAEIVSGFSKTGAAAAGWTIVYQGAYSTGFNYADILNSIAAGSHVALASSSSDGAATFDLFGNTSLTTLQTVTDYNSTILADGAYWYRNNNSVGFTPSAVISQNSADTVNSGYGVITDALDGSQRMSWHGGETNVDGGWRSGLNIWLNGDNTWQRYVLVQGPTEEVPEPASLALLGLGLAGLAASRRRAKKTV